MQIWIDADACPRAVKEVVLRVSARLHIPVSSIAFSLDSATVISTGTDGWVCGWECATGATCFTLKTSSGSWSSTLHPHGDVLAIGHWDGMLRLWDVCQQKSCPARDRVW